MTDTVTWKDVHEFWFGELPDATHWSEQKARQWYAGGEEFDAMVTQRFGETIERAARGELDDWKQDVRGQLSLILLLDQLTRNVYRGSADAFQHDAQARELALELIDSQAERELFPIERVFVYMPLEHAEDLALQDRCVALFEALTAQVPEEIKETFESFTTYAVKHHELIARFGRFPHRNELLGREPRAEEVAYLEDGGESFGQKKK